MTLNEAVEQIKNAAIEKGYSNYEVNQLTSDIKEILYNVDRNIDIDEDFIDSFIEERV